MEVEENTIRIPERKSLELTSDELPSPELTPRELNTSTIIKPVSRTEAQDKKSNLYRVIYASLCFTLLYIAVNSAQNLVSQIYKQLGLSRLGQVCIFVSYCILGLTNTITSHYKKKITAKIGFIFGSFGYLLFVLAGTFTTLCDRFELDTSVCSKEGIYAINIAFCAIQGFCAAFLWISQATYVNDCSDENTKGMFNGYFWSIFQTNQIISGCIITFILGGTDQFTFYAILGIIATVAVTLFMFVRPAVKPPSRAVPPAEPNRTLGADLKIFYGTLGQKKYFFLFISMFVSGMTIAFYTTFLPTVVSNTLPGDPDQNTLNRRLGYALLALAAGEVLAGAVIGKLADTHNKINLLNWTISISESALAMTLFAVIFKSYVFAVACALVWGFGDTAIQTMMNTVISSNFGGNVELFSAYRFIQSFGCVFGSILAILMPTDIPLLYLFIEVAVVLILHLLFFKSVPEENKFLNVANNLVKRRYAVKDAQ